LNIPHDRYVLFFESDEESSSKDVMYFLGKSMEKIGKVDFALAMDAGGGNGE
jgi:hypothetical protein